MALVNNLAGGKPPKVGKQVSIGSADYSYWYRL